jgi:hypothetical protein
MLRFDGVRDFGFAIGSRTAVPAARVGVLLTRPAGELPAEEENLHQLELRLQGVAEDFDARGLSCVDTLRGIGTQVFSKDHEWRAIFGALIQAGTAFDRYARIAVARYLDYLAARRQILRALLVVARPATRARPAAGADHATAAFPTGVLDALERDPALHRLPQGESVVLRVASGRTLSIKLARYDFALEHGRQWALVADDGRRYLLRDGVNSVGRSRDNDVALDAVFRNVSRKHLLAQPLETDAIVLTDLSSSGTFIPPAAIAS